MSNKVCTKCGIDKPATTEYFYAKRENKSGLDGACKGCTRDAQKERYAVNRGINMNESPEVRKFIQAFKKRWVG